MTTILQTIESDLAAAGDWLESEAKSGALALWGLLKQSFIALTSGQAEILHDLLEKLDLDLSESKSLEEIETELLGLASSEELALIEGIASSDIQALIALWKSAQGG